MNKKTRIANGKRMAELWRELRTVQVGMSNENKKQVEKNKENHMMAFATTAMALNGMLSGLLSISGLKDKEVEEVIKYGNSLPKDGK